MDTLNFEQFIELAPDAIIVSNQEGTIIFINSQTEAIFKYKRSELIGQNVDILLPNPLQEQHALKRAAYVENPATRPMGVNKHLTARRSDDTIFPVEISLSPYTTNAGLFVIAIVRDITYKKELEEKLQYTVEHDLLTGLVNRQVFQMNALKAIDAAQRYNRKVAILFMDLDGFKSINDNYGHDIGDLLLKNISKQFLRQIRKSDTIARIGGDEFAILLPEVKKKEDIMRVADKILSIFKTPVKTKHHDCPITISIGIAIYPEDGHDYDTLLIKADKAMYLTKNNGKNDYRFATKES